MKAILGSPHNRVQGFLLAGHVNAVMGYHEYPPLLEEFQIPMVVTGFEPLDIVQGILTAGWSVIGNRLFFLSFPKSSANLPLIAWARAAYPLAAAR